MCCGKFSGTHKMNLLVTETAKSKDHSNLQYSRSSKVWLKSNKFVERSDNLEIIFFTKWVSEARYIFKIIELPDQYS